MEFIAAGGFGVVYKALNILDNNQYAIKKIIIGYLIKDPWGVKFKKTIFIFLFQT